MENFWYVVIFSFFLSIIFFSFAAYHRRQEDTGTSTVHLVIGIILSIITVILFLIMVNINHLYETEPDEDLNLNNTTINKFYSDNILTRDKPGRF